MNSPSALRSIPRFPPRWADVFGEDDSGIFAECELRGVRFVWRWIPPGEFTIGSPVDELGRREDEGPQHEVHLTKGFWLGETPVTQIQWEAVTGQNPSHFKGPDRPVEQVNWLDCRDFIQLMNDQLPGLHAALPTEAQWEYACRARTATAFNDGSPCTQPEGLDPALDALGWFDKNSGGETHLVREKEANAWGLYDMHGNVWEWCRDAWNEQVYASRSKLAVDPEETGDDSALRVVRGGSWFDRALGCRAAFRLRLHPGDRWHDRGLRLSAGQEPAAEPPGAERLLRRAEGRSPEAAAGRPENFSPETHSTDGGGQRAPGLAPNVLELLRVSVENTLTRTDVSAGASHGREIVSSMPMRSLLGDFESEGAVVWLYFDEDGAGQASLGRYRWHQSRANRPGRAPEWRIYYGGSLPAATREGDVLILLRTGAHLCGLIFSPSAALLPVCRQLRHGDHPGGLAREAAEALLGKIADALARLSAA